MPAVLLSACALYAFSPLFMRNDCPVPLFMKRGIKMALSDYIHTKPVLDTPRLRLRPMCAGDVPALRKWMPDRSIYTYWGKRRGRKDRNPELLFEKPEKPSKSIHLGIEEKRTGDVIGDIWVYLIENERMASVAIRIAPACQGKGFGTEALSEMTRFCFEKTELRRLWTKVDVRNAASWRLLEKCGYQREGLIRQGKMVNTWCDYYIYGKLFSDTEENTGRRASGCSAEGSENVSFSS